MLVKHKDNADVAEKACGALRNMAVRDDGQAAAISAGGVPAIVAVLIKHKDDAGVVLIPLHEGAEIGALGFLLMGITPTIFTFAGIRGQHSPVGRVHRLEDELESPLGIGSNGGIHAPEIENVFLPPSGLRFPPHLEGLVGADDLQPRPRDAVRLELPGLFLGESLGQGGITPGLPVVTSGEGADADKKLVRSPGRTRGIEVAGDTDVADEPPANTPPAPSIKGEEVGSQSGDTELHLLDRSRLNTSLRDRVVVPVPNREDAVIEWILIHRETQPEGFVGRSVPDPFIGTGERDEVETFSREP